MEREASPDWLRDFKSPTEDAFMILSSSPSSSSKEIPEGVSAKEESTEVNTTDEITGDSPLVSTLGAGNGLKGTRANEGTPKKRGRPPGKNQKNKGKSSAVDIDETLEDGHRNYEKVISSRRPKGGKRPLDSDQSEGEFRPATKSRKTLPSPKIKEEVAKTPRSSRKNKRLSISEDEETGTLKRVKKEIELESAEIAVDEDDDDETAPISKLSSVRKGVKQPVGSDSAAVSKSTKGRSGISALMALAEDEIVDEDGLGLSQKEELLAVEEITEPSERKAKRISSTLPVMFADKVHRTKVLLECEDDALNLSGDMGAVGRFTVTGQDGEDELFLDLKGVIYKTTIVPSNTFFVVNVGQTEAKVEAIMNDFMQLRPDINQAGDETVVEGTLEDYGFDVDNDGDGGAAPNSIPAAAEGDAEDDDDEKPKKKPPTKGQGKKVAAGKGVKVKAKLTGKGTAKRPRAKAKAATKKPSKMKPAPRKPKAAKG